MNLYSQISNLKLALGKKEAELEHYKGGNSKNTLDSQKVRAVSPFRIPKHGLNTKSEASQGPLDEVKVSEVIHVRYNRLILFHCLHVNVQQCLIK